MFLSVRHKPMQKEALCYKVVDQDTGEEIKHIIWANDETGRYRQHLMDENGKYILNGPTDFIKSKIHIGNIKLVKVIKR